MGIQGTPNMGMVIFAAIIISFTRLLHHRRICRAPFWHFKAKASGFLLDWLRV